MHCEFCGRPLHLPSCSLVIYISMRKRGTQCVLWVGSPTLGNWALPASVKDLQSKSMSRQRWILLRYMHEARRCFCCTTHKAFCEPLSMLVAAGPLRPHWGWTGPVRSATRSRVVNLFRSDQQPCNLKRENHRQLNLQHEYALELYGMKCGPKLELHTCFSQSMHVTPILELEPLAETVAKKYPGGFSCVLSRLASRCLFLMRYGASILISEPGSFSKSFVDRSVNISQHDALFVFFSNRNVPWQFEMRDRPELKDSLNWSRCTADPGELCPLAAPMKWYRYIQ